MLEAPRVQPATMCGDAGKSNHREVLAGPGATKLKRSQDLGDMKLCFSGPSKLVSKFGTITPVLWGKYVLNTFEHPKIVKNPALVGICED